MGSAGGLLGCQLLLSCASSPATPAVAHPTPSAAVSVHEAAAGAAAPAAEAPPNASVSAFGQIEARVRAGEFSNVHGVLVVRRGQTLTEFYRDGEDQRRGSPPALVQFGPEVLHDVRSITKSVVSLLFGIAQGAGQIGGVERSVLSYFPEYSDLATSDRKRIRLGDMLSMTSGLKWSDENVPYTDPSNTGAAMDRAADPVRYVLSQPIESPPGKRYRYSGGDVTVIAEVIRRATGTPIDVYAQRELFEPLGIRDYEWPKDARGVPIPDSGLRLRPRDMAKLGALIIQRGRWQGRQVVPEAWIEAATRAHADTTGAGECGVQYGYYFFVGTRCEGASRLGWVAALGNGGQRILALPSEQLVIVLTAGLYDDPAAYRDVGYRLSNALMAASLP